MPNLLSLRSPQPRNHNPEMRPQCTSAREGIQQNDADEQDDEFENRAAGTSSVEWGVPIFSRGFQNRKEIRIRLCLAYRKNMINTPFRSKSGVFWSVCHTPAQDAHKSRVTTHDLGEFGRDVGHARLSGIRRQVDACVFNRKSAIGQSQMDRRSVLRCNQM
jgi:hypothetical protein